MFVFTCHLNFRSIVIVRNTCITVIKYQCVCVCSYIDLYHLFVMVEYAIVLSFNGTKHKTALRIVLYY